MLPPDYAGQLGIIDTIMLKGATEQDFPALQEAVPTLCVVALFACRQAQRSSSLPDKAWQIKILQWQLFRGARNRVAQQIAAMANYLEEILCNNLAGPGLITYNFNLVTGGEVLLDPIELTTGWALLTSLLHEIVHLAALAHDSMYSNFDMSPAPTQCLVQ